MDCSLPGSSVHGDSPSKNTGVGCHFFLQGIFTIQELNLCLLHWQADSLPLNHLGSPSSRYQDIKRDGLRQNCTLTGSYSWWEREKTLTTDYQNVSLRVSLVSQWYRMHLPMQETWVPSLIWKNSTCLRATNPRHPRAFSCCSAAREATTARNLLEPARNTTTTLLAATREKPTQQRRPSTAKKKSSTYKEAVPIYTEFTQQVL